MPTALLDPLSESCIETCAEAHRRCLQTIEHCLEETPGGMQSDHLLVLVDCIQILPTIADFLRRESAIAPQICQAGARACVRCFDQLHEVADATVQACVEECQKAAQLCEQLAGRSSQFIGV